MKAAQPGAISDFVEELDRIIDKSVVIAVIPPHQPADTSRDLYQATEEALSKTSRQAPISPRYEDFQRQWQEQMSRHYAQQKQVVELLESPIAICIKEHRFPEDCIELQTRNSEFDGESVPLELAVQRDEDEGYWSLNVAVFIPSPPPSKDVMWAIMRPEITFLKGEIELSIGHQSMIFPDVPSKERDEEMRKTLAEMILNGVSESIRAMEVRLVDRKSKIGFVIRRGDTPTEQ